MIRAVLDTNVIVSGMLGFDLAESTPGALLRAWFRRDFELVVAEVLIREIERTLSDEYFIERVDQRIAHLTMTSLHKDATSTALSVTVTRIATHPEDDLVLAAAVSAGTAYLVTGDKQLLRLSAYQGVTIVSPRAFLDILEAGATADTRHSPNQ